MSRKKQLKDYLRLDTGLLTTALIGAGVALWDQNAAMASSDARAEEREKRLKVVESLLDKHTDLKGHPGLAATVAANQATLSRIDHKLDALLLSRGLSYAPPPTPTPPEDEPPVARSEETPGANPG